MAPERNRKSPFLSPRKLTVVPAYCSEAIHEYLAHEPRAKGLDALRRSVRSHLSAVGWDYWYAKKKGGEELRYRAPDGQDYYSLRTACQGCIERETRSLPIQKSVTGEIPKQVTTETVNRKSESEESCVLESEYKQDSCSKYGNQKTPQKRERPLADLFPRSEKNKRRKTDRSQVKVGNHGLCGAKPSSKPTKRARQVVALDHAYCNPRNILSWLISKDIVSTRTKVYYKSEFDLHTMAQGKVTRAGIKCACCNSVYGISSFEAHVTGRTTGRPAAHIVLEDGRSLLDCQKHILRERTMKETQLESQRSAVPIDSDEICSVCHYGGTLLLCDECPSAFHLSCIGLEKLPEGNWFCPSCCCSVCGEKEFYCDTDEAVVHCGQCERGFHLGCLWDTEPLQSENKQEWFCSYVCEKLHTSLQQLSGKSTEVGGGKLRCSMMKFSKDIDNDLNANDLETRAEHHVKLNLALSVFHECFEPIEEEHSKDLVEDVLFSRKSVLKRLNFGGFYIFLLEKGDELVSVATVRIFGGKVAEVPLVATRPQYRRQGMCHILMNFLEKTLTELGVERLLLASIPQVLEAWTSSFGFSIMPEPERKKFLKYTFLDFQGTTMCQKIFSVAPRIKILGPRAPPGEVMVAL